MIRNYIFDFGQVIVHFDPVYMTAQYIENKSDICLVQAVVFDRLYWDKLEAGTITDEEVKQGICSRLPKSLRENACQVYDNWYRHLPFVKGMPKLLRNIKADGGRLYLLSNISIGFADCYTTVPAIKKVFDLFDGLVFSGPIGLTKPNKEIFEYLLNKYKIDQKESFFVDDNIKNIATAKSMGITSYHFKGDCTQMNKFLLGETKNDEKGWQGK